MSSTAHRHTVNLDPADATLVAPYLDSSSPERRALEQLTGASLESTSATLKALALLGAKRVRDQMLRDAYDRAVLDGTFDDTPDLRARGQRRAARRAAAE